MKKTTKQKPQDEQSIDILKRVAKRVEEATVDISSIKTDLKFVKFRLSGVEHNTDLMQVDIEKMKNDMGDMKNDIGGLKADGGGLPSKIEGAEERLNKRIEHVADLITIELGGKLQNHGKRIQKLEHAQQVV